MELSSSGLRWVNKTETGEETGVETVEETDGGDGEEDELVEGGSEVVVGRVVLLTLASVEKKFRDLW